eukprot:scaffold37292_cov155-Skeletonema_dohrnii-CCMP3373.AAC.1
MGMEEKLAAVSSLESRCERLEAKCSSLENMLVTTSQSTKEHIDRKFDSLYIHLDQKCSSLENRLDTKVDSVHVKVDKSLKFHEYNEMLIKNQKWEYSAAVRTEDELIDYGIPGDEADHLAEDAQDLKSMTTKMRRGEFSNERSGKQKSVRVEMYDYDTQDSDALNNMLLPHWKEFAAALKQFTPAINMLPDDCESIFMFGNVQLNHEAMLLMKEALIGKPFQKLDFTTNDDGDGAPEGICVDAILDIVESNKHLRKLEIDRNRIGRDHIEKLCSAVHTHALLELSLFNSFEPGIGDEMLTSLLSIDGLKLEKLDMSSNNITSAVGMLLSDFIATNPRMRELNISSNDLNDRDAALIANALRSNSTLRNLYLYGNSITEVGAECLRLVLCDESSLNAASDSNHNCNVPLTGNPIDRVNSHEQGQINRGRKIYSILSNRNETMSNVQHFGDIDVKILPNILEAVQKYATKVHEDEDHKVKPLSIVYETMRKWEKAFYL